MVNVPASQVPAYLLLLGVLGELLGQGHGHGGLARGPPLRVWASWNQRVGVGSSALSLHNAGLVGVRFGLSELSLLLCRVC